MAPAALLLASLAVASYPGTRNKYMSPEEAPLDSDQDGFPDQVELTDARDREAFREWMVAVALAQKRAPDPRWRPEERDCAGLVRFAYREALRRHGAGYSMRGLRSPPPVDVSRYSFPAVPWLGEALFLVPGAEKLPAMARTVGGRTFAPFVTGRVLMEGSAHRLGADPAMAEPGDLLFFEHQGSARFQRHLMLAAGRLPDGDRLFVYHTGPEGGDPGEIRLLPLDSLRHHPDTDWHPTPDNPRFLGVYRWKILD